MTGSIVFMGTPDFSVPCLEALVGAGYDVRAVITNPDRPAGRGRQAQAPPIKEAARRLGIGRIEQPATLRDGALRASIEALAPDLLVVVAYGRILGPRWLGVPRVAPVNVHASLLPRLRGAAPIQWSIARGDRETGVAIMRMAPGMDTGGVYAARAIAIGADETAGALHDRLSALGASLLIEALPGIVAGGLEATPQPDAGVTMAPMLSKADGALRFDEPAQRVHDRARGMTPWPGASCRFRGKAVKLLATTCVDATARVEATPGEVVGLDEGAITVACAPGTLALRVLQPASKPAQEARDFINGYRVQVGDRFEADPRVAERQD